MSCPIPKERSMKLVMVLTLTSIVAAMGSVDLAVAADMSPPEAAAPAPAAKSLAKARQLIDARQWEAAQAELKRLDDRGSADWNNLMGYAARKAGNPDLSAS